MKRLIGRDFNDPNVQKLLKTFPFDVVEENNRIYIKVTYKNEEKSYLPEQLSAMVLEDLKKSAEAYLDAEISKAVITVPAYFNNAQRQSTMDAAELAGLEVIKLINEPTAAAISYGLNNVGKKVILIYDFGGGTFDVSLLRLNNKDFEVIGIDGDPFLGGEDLDNALVEYFVGQFEEENENIRENKGLMRQLKARCEEAKRFLSSALEASFTLEGTELKGKITRALFEEINYELFEKTITLVEKVIAEAKLTKEDIDDVVLVGGSSRIPIVQTMLKEFFNNKKLNKNINPDECVAQGAAIRAAFEEKIPSQKFKGLKLMDVCPLSLGFALHNGEMHVIIPRNSKIPIKKSQFTQLASRDQTEAEVEIYEGERYICNANHFLGKFELTDIPKDGRIEVIYEINENGILQVTAIEENTKRSNQITIENKSRLKKSEIQQMIEEAKAHCDDDQQERERVEVLNQFENRLYFSRRDAKNSIKTQKITAEAYEAAIREIEEKMAWLNKNRTASKQELQKRYDDLKNLL